MMKFKEMSPNKKKALYAGIGILLAAVLGIGVGISAKYTKQETVSGTLTVNTNLITDISAMAPAAVKNPDGTYSEGTDAVSSNSFFVLAGTDISTDIEIMLTDKSNIPSYLYVEIDDNTASGITYALTDEWTEIPGLTGPHGGRVYCYNEKLDNNSPDSIHVLNNETVYVSETIGSDTATSLTAYPYIAEAEDKTPAEAFDPNSCGTAYTAAFTPYPRGTAQAAMSDPDSHEMSHLYVQANDNGYAIYTRAILTVNWQNAEGDVLAPAPVEGTDYTVEYGDGWFVGSDGIRYWPAPLMSGDRTDDFIVSVTEITEAPEGYKYAISVSVQTVQAPGTTDADDIPVITSAWGCTVNADGTITK